MSYFIYKNSNKTIISSLSFIQISTLYREERFRTFENQVGGGNPFRKSVKFFKLIKIQEITLHKSLSLALIVYLVNVNLQKTSDLLTFTKEVLNGNLLLCSVI